MKMLLLTTLFGAMAASLLSPGALAQSAAESSATTASGSEPTSDVPVSTADRTFFKKAAIGGMTEIAAGKLAAAQGSSDQVKDFGQTMVDDHTKIAGELKNLAEQKHVTLPNVPDERHRTMLSTLKGKHGKAFDTAFIADMKKGHIEAISAFSEATKSKDADVAKFATMTLPTLKDHLRNIPDLKMIPDTTRQSSAVPASQ